MAELGMLRSDEILRLQMDLFGDGKEAIFLTYRAGGSKLGPTWTAYVPTSENGYYRIDSIQFRPDLYHAGAVPELAGPGTLLALHPGKGGGNLVRYDFKDGTAHYSIARTLDYANPNDRKLFAAIFKHEVDQPLPADESGNPPYQVLSATSILKKLSSAPPSQALTDTPGSRLATATPIPLPKRAKDKYAPPVEGRRAAWLLLAGGSVAVFVAGIWVSKRRTSR